MAPSQSQSNLPAMYSVRRNTHLQNNEQTETFEEKIWKSHLFYNVNQIIFFAISSFSISGKQS